MHIGKSELISFKIAVNEAVQTYGLTPSAAALDVINLIIDHNKKDQLKKELEKLLTQVFTVKQLCFSQNKSMIAMLNLQNRGITEERILYLNNLSGFRE